VPRFMQKLLKRLNIHYLIIIIFIVIPLYPKFPLFNVPGTYVSIRLEDFLMLISFFILVGLALLKYKIILKNEVSKSIVLFLAAAIVSVLSAIFVTKTVEPHISILHYLRRIEYFVPFFIALVTVHKNYNLKVYATCLLMVVIYAFVYGVLQKYFNLPIVTTQNQEYSKGVALTYTPGGHLNSTFAGHYDLASFIILVAPIFYTSFWVFKNRISKIALCLGILASLWLLVNSVSRISIVSYLVAVSISLAFLKKYKAIVIAILISIIFIAFSSNLIERYSRIIEVTFSKVGSSFVARASEEKNENVFEDRSTSIRLNVEWPRAMRAFSKNPLVGTGFSSITLATDNDYLRLLGELGVVGFLAFLGILISLGRALIRYFPKNRNIGMKEAWVAGYSGSFVGVCLNAFFIDIFESSKFAIVFWLFTGIFISMRSRKLFKK